MPGANYIVFQNMRPPVAIDSQGTSPLRSKRAQEIFAMGEGDFQDRKGLKITKE